MAEETKFNMTKKIFITIEKVHNRLSDTNFVWFPFLWLKLEANQELTSKHLLKMTIWFSFYFNVGYILKKLLFGEPMELAGLVQSQLFFIVLFFCWFHLVTKQFWNRRARRLISEEIRDK